MSAKKISRREMLKGLGLAVAGTALAACAPKVVKETVAVEKQVEKVVTATPQPIKLRFWQNAGSRQEMYEGQAAKFHEKNPDIVVEVVFTGSGRETMQKVQAALAAGDPPEISFLYPYMASMFFDDGVLIAIDEYLATDTEFNKDDIYQVMWDACLWKGHTILAPKDYKNTVWILYYNKETFEKGGVEAPPTNWDELVEISQQLTQDTDGDGKVDQFGISLRANDLFSWLCFVYNNGGRYYSEDLTKCLLDQPPAVEALTFWDQLFNEHKVVPEAPIDQGFQLGKVAMQIGGSWSVKGLYKAEVPFGVARVPFKVAPKAHMNVNGWGIYKTTPEKQDAAWRFVSYILSKENYEGQCKSEFWCPIRKSHAQDPAWQEWVAGYPELKTICEMPEDEFQPMPITKAGTKPNTIVQEQMELALHREKTVEEALSDAVKAVNELLA